MSETSRAARRRRVLRRRAAVALGASLAALTAACAGPPSSGAVRTTQLNKQQNHVAIGPRLPVSGSSPEQVVEGFLAAAAGDAGDPQFLVAQQYMLPDLRKAWSTDPHVADGEVTVGDRVSFRDSSFTTADGIPSTGVPPAEPGASGRVTYDYVPIASLDSRGFYVPADSSSVKPITFRVKVDEDRQWKISENPGGRLIDLNSLNRAYQALPVFVPGPEEKPVSVGQIYVVPSDAQATYTALAKAVLHLAGADPAPEPTPTVTLNPGTNPPEIGVSIPPTKVPQGQLLTALNATFRAAEPALQQNAATNSAQFAKTVLTVAGVTQVRNLDPGQPSSSYPSMYFVSGPNVLVANPDMSASAVGQPPVVQKDVQLFNGQATPARHFGKIAVSQARRPSDHGVTLAALVTASGDAREIGDVDVYPRLEPGKPAPKPVVWYRAHDATAVTDLAWDPVDGSLWVVDDGDLFHVAPPVDGVASTPKRISPQGSDLYQRIRISADGNQAVLVTTASPANADLTTDAGRQSLKTQATSVDVAASDVPNQAQLVRIDRESDTGGAPTLRRQFQLVPPRQTLTHIADVSWAGGRMVELLAKDAVGAPAKIYRLFSDGSQDSRLVDADPVATQSTRITATLVDPAGVDPRVFTNGTRTEAQTPTSAIYWKNKTFSYLVDGDDPVTATILLGP